MSPQLIDNIYFDILEDIYRENRVFNQKQKLNIYASTFRPESEKIVKDWNAPEMHEPMNFNIPPDFVN